MRAMEQLENTALSNTTQQAKIETKQRRLEGMVEAELRALLRLDSLNHGRTEGGGASGGEVAQAAARQGRGAYVRGHLGS